MSLAEFAGTFRPQIRVRLDWAKLSEFDWAVELHTLHLPSDASLIYAPWYALQDGSACGYNSLGAKPQSLLDVSKNASLLANHQVSSAFTGETKIAVPAYLIANNKYLLLDGNHRSVSSILASHKLELEMHVLVCPISPEILPDLAHWLPAA